MHTESVQSHYFAAQELLSQGELNAALHEAELAVDAFWKYGDMNVAKALPMLSMLRHSNSYDGDLFESLDDLPISCADSLMSESRSLHEQYDSEASSKMLSDVTRFMNRWVGERRELWTPESKSGSTVDEKIAGLRGQIAQFYAKGERDLAVEASLELANEYALRGKNKRALKLFAQVAEKSKRPHRTAVRVDCLLDFGQFMSRNGKHADAERLLRVAAGVSRNARDKEKYAHVLASLGVVLMHQSKTEAAKKHLEKAESMLDVWDLDADIVSHHLQALREEVPCGCPEATPDLAFADADWD